MALPRFDSDTLILLSSNAQPRYADDIVRAMALPRGAQLRFRYDSRLLAPNVLANIPAEQLAGRRSLICYLTPGSRTEKRKMIPVRLATLVRAERVGSSCVFTLAASDYVENVSDHEIRAGVPADQRAALPQNPTTDVEGEGQYVFLTHLRGGVFTRRVEQAFETTVQALSQHSPFDGEGLPFFAVHRIAKVPGSNSFGTWPKPVQASQGIFSLRSGERYEIEIYTYSVSKPEAGVRLRAEPDDASVQLVSPASVAVDSRYDVKSFVFTTETDVHRRFGGITLGLSVGAPADQQPLRHDISLRFVFRAAWARGLAQALAAALGTTGPAFLVAQRAGVLRTDVAVAIIAMGIAAGLGTVFLSRSKS